MDLKTGEFSIARAGLQSRLHEAAEAELGCVDQPLCFGEGLLAVF